MKKTTFDRLQTGEVFRLARVWDGPWVTGDRKRWSEPGTITYVKMSTSTYRAYDEHVYSGYSTVAGSGTKVDVWVDGN